MTCMCDVWASLEISPAPRFGRQSPGFWGASCEAELLNRESDTEEAEEAEEGKGGR